MSISAEHEQHSPERRGNSPERRGNSPERRVNSPELLDAVVTRALAIECDCLLLVGLPLGGADMNGAKSFRLPTPIPPMQRQFERILAAWQLLSRALDKTQAQQAVARVEQMLTLLPALPSFGWVAQDLLDHAQDRKARSALRQVMDEWSSLQLPPVIDDAVACRGQLSRLLQEDSSAWRLAFAGKRVTADRIIRTGFGRTYARAASLEQKYRGRELGVGKLGRWRQQITLVAAQLELFDPELSEENRETLWYLQRLERNLQQRIELQRFTQALAGGVRQKQKGDKKGDSKSASKRLDKAYARCHRVAQQRQHQFVKRAKNLARAGLQRSVVNYCQAIEIDSVKIGPGLPTSVGGE